MLPICSCCFCQWPAVGTWPSHLISPPLLLFTLYPVDCGHLPVRSTVLPVLPAGMAKWGQGAKGQATPEAVIAFWLSHSIRHHLHWALGSVRKNCTHKGAGGFLIWSRLWSKKTVWVWVPTPLFLAGNPWARYFTLSELLFSHQTQVKHLELCHACSKRSVKVSYYHCASKLRKRDFRQQQFLFQVTWKTPSFSYS